MAESRNVSVTFDEIIAELDHMGRALLKAAEMTAVNRKLVERVAELEARQSSDAA